MIQEGGLAFARLWGEPYTGDPKLVLLTHQTVADSKAVNLAVVKQVQEGTDGVVRAVWWSENNVLKNHLVAITPTLAGRATLPVHTPQKPRWPRGSG